MSFRLPLVAAFALTPLPLAAQEMPDAGPGITVTAARETLPDELVLPPDHIITITIDGMPLRMLVTANASGPAAIDPAIPVRRQWRAAFQILWDYGNDDVLRSGGVWRIADFGDRKAQLPVMWSFGRPTLLADGTIGIHHLPYKRIVMPLAAPVGEQTVQRFPLQRFAGQRAMRVGTEIDADGRKLKAIFATDYTDNVVTAPTANWLATRFDGGFLPGSEGKLRMHFGVERRTRMMRLARPLELGDLLIDRFAVRIEDHGKARDVGEAGENDPRFDPNEIVVSERKPRGRVDMLTRIGRSQISHCSELTYDLALNEIRLACGTPAAS